MMIDEPISDSDLRLMQRCIELSRTATLQGEFPFACVIGKGGEVVAEATNRVARDQDVTRHAEIVAIAAAQQALGKGKLPIVSSPQGKSGTGRATPVRVGSLNGLNPADDDIGNLIAVLL
jgi:pyrimidine deaminase RibD-like protein